MNAPVITSRTAGAVRCASCGRAMEREVLAFEIVENGRRFTLRQPGWYCWTCSLAVHSAADLAVMAAMPDSDC